MRCALLQLLLTQPRGARADLFVEVGRQQHLGEPLMRVSIDYIVATHPHPNLNVTSLSCFT